MASIQLRQVKKTFGPVNVIQGIDLHINDGEFVVFVGPSGCGKSTLLRLIAGLEQVSAGYILIDGNDVTHAPPYDRGLSMVFQSYALYPHMSVYDNIAFSLRTQGMDKGSIARRVDEAARMLQLGDYLDRKPKALSGGQRQRVAIGRAVVRNPSAFLFDEPLSNLDAALRADTRLEIARLHKQLGTTMVYVTHDQTEAMTLADRIVVLQGGNIMQANTPYDLYERPGNTFVAEFIGSPKMNLMACAGDSAHHLHIANGPTLEAPAFHCATAHQIGIRPEHLSLCGADTALLQGSIEQIEYLGADSCLHVKREDGSMITVRVAGRSRCAPGETVHLTAALESVHVFDVAGQSLRR
ncbi:ABC transporter ATP-binding protein [Verminephrobacter aporrectodeae subsp. tuberculatae]|uniref:ABC transporter ATP-binding protein n=1 Tax=Verminephrobacter aporrectodeae TaxID=1110389 RepID=UPI00223827C5|nr:ABC transporter ATP-binding protein [Verminephrobacter aporrectodeae]MCW5256347.1 ABC transporter ATP-binding protein [Verminephrobacter aporrectodeae subsp. tuberculatae]